MTTPQPAPAAAAVAAHPSDGCQRWRQATPSWRRPSDGGFTASRYDVQPIAERHARPFVETHHYSRSWPSASHSYALLDNAQPHDPLVGVCVLAVPMQAAVLTNVLPELTPYRQSLELSRLVLLDDVPANAESWFVAAAFKHLAAHSDVRGVVSFSDPMPRWREHVQLDEHGRITATLQRSLITPGHVGTVYQALGAHHTAARGTARTLTLIRRIHRDDATAATGRAVCDWVVLPDRALSKIRAGEQGWAGAARRLVAAGADEPDPHDLPGWLSRALPAAGARRVRHPGNYRYVFTLGTRSQRRSIHIALPRAAYPKLADLAVTVEQAELTGATGAA